MKSDQSKTKAELIKELGELREAQTQNQIFRQTVLDSLKVGISYIDADLKLVFTNQKFKMYAEELGLETDHIGKHIKEAFPFLPDSVIDEYHQVIGTNKTLTTEESNVFGDITIYSETRKIPVVKDGLVTGVFTIVKDITESKRAEATLIKEKNISQKYLDLAGTMILALNHKCEISLINQKGCQILGDSKQNIMGKNWIDNFIPERLREDVKVNFQKIIDGEIDIFEHHENPVITKDGEEKIIAWHNTLVRDDEGRITGTLSSGEDITEKKLADKAILKSEEKYRLFFETARDGAFVTSIDGKFLDCNQGLVNLFGYDSIEEMKQLDVTDIYKNPTDRISVIDTIVKNGFISSISFSGQRKDGSSISLLMSASIVQNDDGKIIGFQGTVTDITEQMRIEAEREEALEKAQNAEKIKTLFLANISHEIRTPLNGILGFTELLKDTCVDQLPDETKEFFDVIDESGHRLMNTMHSILDMSQIESGTFDTKPQVMDLQNILLEQINKRKPEAERKNLKLNFQADFSQPGLIEGDEYCINQTFSHLLDNAVKYTKSGQIDVHLGYNQDKFVITITDTGIGIADDYLTHLFKPFSQESEGFTKHYQGVGLGLSLVKKYLDLNSGKIAVTSKKGVGTTFTIELTSFSPIISTFGQELISGNHLTKSPKPVVLVVEDDDLSQRLVELYLNGDYEVVFAESVAKSKRLIREKIPDMILLDLSLEGNEDGLELVKYLRRSLALKDLPVIATTAHAFTTDRNKTLEAGCNDYLAKPITQGQLLDKIEKFRKQVD